MSHLSDTILELLLKDLESDRVERKASVADTGKIREAICAFANDLPDHREPGVLFAGANDDGSGARLAVTDQLLLTLSNMHSDGNITPFPTMVVGKRTVAGCEMAVVIVEPSDAPPVRLRGRVWVRVGPRRAVATAEEERRLTEKRRSKDLPFDIRPLRSATLEDLNVDLFHRVYLPASVAPDVLAENERSVEQQLASARFLSIDAPVTPTVLGLLVAGKDPQEFVPGAYVQFLRIDGIDLTDPIKDQKEVSGPLSEMLTFLDQLIEAHISTAADISTGPTEIRLPDYPIVALQQLARNAVLHRVYEGTNAPVRITWFNDRIEIQSPGGPFGQVNRQNFGRPGVTDYRNPHLAEALKNLGYVQRFGMGIQLARKELQRNGNPELEFQVEDSYVLAIVRRRP